MCRALQFFAICHISSAWPLMLQEGLVWIAFSYFAELQSECGSMAVSMIPCLNDGVSYHWYQISPVWSMSRLRVAGEDEEARVIMHRGKLQTRQANLHARALRSHQEAKKSKSCLLVLSQSQEVKLELKGITLGWEGSLALGLGNRSLCIMLPMHRKQILVPWSEEKHHSSF